MLNKSIGILTFHRATNYGALLQAYALQKVIENMGHDVKIVDYRCGGVGQLFLSLEGPNFKVRFHRFLYNCLLLIQYPFRLRRRKVYTTFTDKYMKLSEANFNLSDEKWGCFDENCALIIDCMYDDIRLKEEYLECTREGESLLFDTLDKKGYDFIIEGKKDLYTTMINGELTPARRYWF